MDSDKFCIVAGNGCLDLAKGTAKLVKCELNENTTISAFNNSETDVNVNIGRNRDVYIIQSFGARDKSTDLSVDQLLMQLILTANALKNNGANNVIAIIPCYGYARQDRVKFCQGKPSSSAVVAEMLQMDTCNLSSIFTVDLHCEQIQNAFPKVPLQNLYVAPVFARYLVDKLQSNNNNNNNDNVKIYIIAPDHGATTRAKLFKMHFENLYGKSVEFAVIDKERKTAGVIDSMVLSASPDDIKDSICYIIDDMGDTCGTLCKSAELIKSHGAKEVSAIITHPVLSKNANELIKQSILKKVYVSDSISVPEGYSDKFEVVTLDYLLATVIKNIQNGLNRDISDIYELDVLNYKNIRSTNQETFFNLYNQSKSLKNIKLLIKAEVYPDSTVSMINDKIYSVNNLKVGVLSNNKQKIECVQKINSTWKVIPILPKDYKPIMEQPFGEELTIECLEDRFYSVSEKLVTWGIDLIIGIENGLKYDKDTNVITEITQVAFFHKTGGMNLKPHYTSGRVPSYIIRELELIEKNKGQTTFGNVLKSKFNMNDKNWQPELFKIDRSTMMDQALRQPCNKMEDLNIFINHCVLRTECKIELYQDFPKEGVLFKNFFPILRQPKVNKAMIDLLVEYCRIDAITDIFVISSRGYLFSAIGYILNIPVHPVFKLGRLPDSAVKSIEYKKEYGTDVLCIEKDLRLGPRIAVIDDLIATGGSLNAVYDLINPDENTAVIAFSLLYVDELKEVAKNNLSRFNSVIPLL